MQMGLPSSSASSSPHYIELNFSGLVTVALASPSNLAQIQPDLRDT